MARPLSLAAPPANEWFNPVHLRRRNRDGNEESTGRICDEVRRIADYGGGRVSRVTMPERHFPEPWFVEELDACFVVKDLNGQALAYMYFEKELRHRHRPSELLRAR